MRIIITSPRLQTTSMPIWQLLPTFVNLQVPNTATAIVKRTTYSGKKPADMLQSDACLAVYVSSHSTANHLLVSPGLLRQSVADHHVVESSSTIESGTLVADSQSAIGGLSIESAQPLPLAQTAIGKPLADS